MAPSNENESQQDCWYQYFEQLSLLVSDIERRNKGDLFEQRYLQERCQYAIESLQVVEAILSSLPIISRNYDSSSSSVPVGVINKLLNEFYVFIRMLDNEVKSNKEFKLAVLGFSKTLEQTGRPGRPKVLISENTLLDLRELGYNWTEIAKMLMVSRWTINRRVRELNIEELTGYSKVTDDQLDQKILELKESTGPLAGRSWPLAS